ncbi:hypothetical protein FOL47_001685 [Perkinsus chesapeaki]|uniref:Uncharacterized protein n=1 Tax=Perkinsus chesapeaki TaxID=330153 RepID=A0A7J6MHY2_PERCH|nr:hypothetical protein FOL47_001685 [Perkinsus chesapeaki]
MLIINFIGIVSHFLFVAFALTSEPREAQQSADDESGLRYGDSISSYGELEPTFETFKGRPGGSTNIPQKRSGKKHTRPNTLALSKPAPPSFSMGGVMDDKQASDDKGAMSKSEGPFESSFTFTHDVVPSVDSFLEPVGQSDVTKFSSFPRFPATVNPAGTEGDAGIKPQQAHPVDSKELRFEAEKMEEATKEAEKFNTLPKAKKFASKLTRRESTLKKRTISNPTNFGPLSDHLPIEEKNVKERKRLSKEDIGEPENFRHVVGYELVPLPS